MELRLAVALVAVLMAGCSDSTPVPDATPEPAPEPVRSLAPLPENVTVTESGVLGAPIVSFDNVVEHAFTLSRDARIHYEVRSPTAVAVAFELYSTDDGTFERTEVSVEGEPLETVVGDAWLPAGDYQAWGVLRTGAVADIEMRLGFSEDV